MENLQVGFFIEDARKKLQGKDARHLAAIHTGITVAAALLITLLQYLLAEGIGNTPGLSGLGTQSVLETGQKVLQWANMILLPFWSLGFLYAALRWAEDQNASRGDLLMGFHRVGPCLGLMLNRAMLAILVMILCINISSTVYMMTPASDAVSDLAVAAGGDMDEVSQMLMELDSAVIMDLFYSMIPMLAICAILCAVILVPLMYRFRMAEFVILDEPRARGLSSMLLSAALLRRHCWQLFRLDLRFWWYYALKALCILLCYLDLLLTAMGITPPVSGEVMYFACYGLYLIALFAVEATFRPRVTTAYASMFLTFKGMGPVQKKAPEVPENMPWDEQ